MTNFYNNLFDTLAVTDLRREANNARNTATDQYEADVANYLDREVGAIEKGIAGLLDEKFYEQIPKDTDSSWMYKKENIDYEGTVEYLYEQFLLEKDPRQGELKLDNPNSLGAKAKR